MFRWDILEFSIKMSVSFPNTMKLMGNIPPVIMAITVPPMISAMSQRFANLNYKHVEQMEKAENRM